MSYYRMRIGVDEKLDLQEGVLEGVEKDDIQTH